MSLPLRENATSSSARTAVTAAGLVLGVQVVQAVVGAVMGVFGSIVYSGLGGGSPFAPIGGVVYEIGGTALPFAVGVFLALWCVAPITAGLRLGQVVLRSLVAAAIAAALTLVVSAVLAIGGVFTSVGPLFGASFPFGSPSDIGYAVFGTVQTALYALVSLTPLVILAAVLTWLWTHHGSRGAAGPISH